MSRQNKPRQRKPCHSKPRRSRTLSLCQPIWQSGDIMLNNNGFFHLKYNRKISCRTCIRGHRSAWCNHLYRNEMVFVRPTGRRAAACKHEQCTQCQQALDSPTCCGHILGCVRVKGHQVAVSVDLSKAEHVPVRVTKRKARLGKPSTSTSRKPKGKRPSTGPFDIYVGGPRDPLGVGPVDALRSISQSISEQLDHRVRPWSQENFDTLRHNPPVPPKENPPQNPNPSEVSLPTPIPPPPPPPPLSFRSPQVPEPGYIYNQYGQQIPFIPSGSRIPITVSNEIGQTSYIPNDAQLSVNPAHIMANPNHESIDSNNNNNNNNVNNINNTISGSNNINHIISNNNVNGIIRGKYINSIISGNNISSIISDNNINSISSNNHNSSITSDDSINSIIVDNRIICSDSDNFNNNNQISSSNNVIINNNEIDALTYTISNANHDALGFDSSPLPTPFYGVIDMNYAMMSHSLGMYATNNDTGRVNPGMFGLNQGPLPNMVMDLGVAGYAADYAQPNMGLDSATVNLNVDPLCNMDINWEPQAPFAYCFSKHQTSGMDAVCV